MPIELTVKQAHHGAWNEVNRWRGHCIERFARIEQSAGRALGAMGGSKVPHTFGDKIKALASAMGPDSPRAHSRIAKTLADAVDVFEQRNRLVHSTGRVLLDSHGHWVWQYQFQPSGKPEVTGFFNEKEALEMEQRLHRMSQSLCALLEGLTVKIDSVKP